MNAAEASKPLHRRAWGKLLWARFKLFHQHRHNSHVLERVGGVPIVVLPQVFNPALIGSGAWFARQLPALLPAVQAVLDMGTGSGVCAVFAAQRARRVRAVDINPEAVRCARLNALLNHLEDKLDVRQSDLFESVGGERFDAVLFNPPFFRGTPRTLWDQAWRSNDVVERFAAGLRDHLTATGFALVLLSTEGDTPTFLDAFRNNGFAVGVAAERDFINERLTIYRLQ